MNFLIYKIDFTFLEIKEEMYVVIYQIKVDKVLFLNDNVSEVVYYL